MSTVIRSHVIANAGTIVQGLFTAGDDNCNDEDLYVTLLLPPGDDVEKMINDNKKAIIDLAIRRECNFTAEDFAKERFIMMIGYSITIGDPTEHIQVLGSYVVSK